MTLRPWHNASAAALLITALPCLMAPVAAAGQWVPATEALITLQTPAPPSPTPGASSSLPSEPPMPRPLRIR